MDTKWLRYMHCAHGTSTVCALIFAGFNIRGFRGYTQYVLCSCWLWSICSHPFSVPKHGSVSDQEKVVPDPHSASRSKDGQVCLKEWFIYKYFTHEYLSTTVTSIHKFKNATSVNTRNLQNPAIIKVHMVPCVDMH